MVKYLCVSKRPYKIYPSCFRALLTGDEYDVCEHDEVRISLNVHNTGASKITSILLAHHCSDMGDISTCLRVMQQGL